MEKEETYTMEDALNDARQELSEGEPPDKPEKGIEEESTEPDIEEGIEQPEPETEEEPKEDKPEEEKPEEVAKPPTEDDETKKAVEFYNLMTNSPDARRAIYEQLEKEFREEKKDLPEDKEKDERFKNVEDSLDDDVKEFLNDLVDQKLKIYKETMDNLVRENSEEKRQAAEQAARKEYDDFVAAHTEDVKKYEKDMVVLGQTYPDLLRSGRKGLETLLKLASYDDKMKEKVAAEVEKAMGRANKVSGKVQKFSTSQTPREANSAKKQSLSFEECFQEAKGELVTTI